MTEDRKRKLHNVTTSIDEETYQTIREIADYEDRTLSAQLRRMLRESAERAKVDLDRDPF